jgi:glycosyltransferase involved in cell wall biosynthesis
MPSQAPTTPTLSVIVPATGRSQSVARCCEAIEGELGEADELIVVTEPPGAGPAAARNAGATRAAGDVLAFVDADVVLHPGALDRIRSAFAADPTLVALFGSYDDSPEAPGLVSGFRNLLHHHVHHQGAGDAATFWAGIGAIRRGAFEGSGGFDAERYPAPSVEDIELGLRLTRGGARIVLDPRIQGTHLKGWSLAGMVRTDFASRGVPWVELLLRPGTSRAVLNLGWHHRLSAAAAVLAAGALPARRPRALVAAILALVLLNRPLYGLLWRRRGPTEAVAGVALHALHHLTAVAAVPAGVAVHLARDDDRAIASSTTSAMRSASAG